MAVPGALNRAPLVLRPEVKMNYFAKDKTIVLEDSISIGDHRYGLNELPPALRLHPDLGIALRAEARCVRRIHLDEFTCHPRAVTTADGEIILFYAAGNLHYGWMQMAKGGNRMYQVRSRDNGRTWSEPVVSWSVPYGQHAAVPLRPWNERRIYVFTTEPCPEAGYRGGENAPLAMRWSDDDGHTWTPPKFIRPRENPDWLGMSAMRAAECGDGAWILGTHCGNMVDGRCVGCTEYFLRTTDRGESWTMLPDASGWTIPGGRIHEGRPLYLGNGELMGFFRTSEGHLWTNRSFDNGRSWSKPEPSVLAHFEAPPMVFMLSDGRIVSFIHNRSKFDHAVHEFAHETRSQLYVCVTSDRGHTWSKPVIFAVEAGVPPILSGWLGTTPMVSYCDLLEKEGMLHIFIDHEMRQVIQATIAMDDFNRLLNA